MEQERASGAVGEVHDRAEGVSDKQLLKVLKEAKKDPGDPGRTVKELAKEMFGSESPSDRAKVWDRLGPEVDAGKVIPGRGMRRNRAHIWHAEPVYRVTGK